MCVYDESRFCAAWFIDVFDPGIVYRHEAGVFCLDVIQPIPPNVQSLIYSLRSDNDEVRKAAARALGEIAHNAAVPALTEALKDENGSVRHSAASALRKIGTPEALKALGIQ